MNDTLLTLSRRPYTRRVLKWLGLPTPLALRRSSGPFGSQPLLGTQALLGGMHPSPASLLGSIEACLRRLGAEVNARISALADETAVHALVFDARGVQRPEDLSQVYAFFHPAVGRLAAHGRAVVLTGDPRAAASAAQAASRRALEGFVRSLAKEIGKRAATANLIYVDDGGADRVAPVLQFLLSTASAYVDGQPLHISAEVARPADAAAMPMLQGKIALVTGAARGIGAATARRLALEGAHVVCVDIAAEKAALDVLAAALGGTALALDVTAGDAVQAVRSAIAHRSAALDVVVHNAGITRDKTLARMPAAFWDALMELNLTAILRLNEGFLAEGLLQDFARIVCLSSISGIAGNVGQTNYSAAKAGLIGYVAAQAPQLAGRGITINAVAPGFVETRMTAALPLLIREAGRRMNSLSQGAQPEDVAEVITFLCTPGASGISGQTLRVCGQSLLGA